MEDNIYAPPKADLGGKDSLPFFITSARKFWVLTFMTAGVYFYYWFYKQWECHKYHYGNKIIPVARVIFSIFYVYSLFSLVSKAAKKARVKPLVNLKLLAVISIVLMIVETIVDKIVERTDLITYLDYVSYSLLYIGLIPMFILQVTINKTLGDPKGSQNSSFSIYNYIFILLGVVLYASIIATYLEVDFSFLQDAINTLMQSTG